VMQYRTKQQGPNCTQHRSRRGASSLRLDQNAFKNFWPLLDDSRDYARLSGCRFRSRSFDGIDSDDSPRQEPEASFTAGVHSDDADKRLAAARAQAAPAVYRFAKRLRAGETALLEELDKAFRIVMAEGVRSAMIATCQLLELWPPSAAPAGVANDDCTFQDVSAPVPVIAQRLYNDEKQRRRMAGSEGGADPMSRMAMMASFIVEFASAAGVPLPESPKTYEMMLSEFKAQAMAWEQRQGEKDSTPKTPTSPVEKFASNVLAAVWGGLTDA